MRDDEPYTFRITTRLRDRLQETRAALEEAGIYLCKNEVPGDVEQIRHYLEGNEKGKEIADGKLITLSLIYRAVSDLRALLEAEITSDYSSRHPSAILEKLEKASLDARIHNIGEENSLQQLFHDHGRELEVLKQQLQAQTAAAQTPKLPPR